MDELSIVDFEELIDLNLSLPSVSQKSSQEPITDVLDKMCEAMDESNFTMEMNNILKKNENENEEIVPDDDIVNLDDFEDLLATVSLCDDEGNLVTDDTLEIDDKKNDKIVPDDDVVDLDEFENLITTAALCNGEINSVMDDISQISENDIVEMPHNTKDLDEFESISVNTCLFIDDEDTTDTSINKVSNVQRVMSYEVSVDFENECALTTERDEVKKEDITSANKYTVHTISLESTATKMMNGNENCIDLETAEFGVVNTVNKLNTANKEYENGLATVKVECKVETNNTENIVTVTTINDYELKYENAVVPSETDCKNTIETLSEGCENRNTDSDDGYDSSDFEFISEQQASKAGIFTRSSKNSINTQQSLSKNAKNNPTQNTSRQSTSNNFDNRLGKNEASLSDYIKYSKYRYQRCYSRAASELHVIPEGEGYLDMFRGEYAPVVVNNLYSLRNKRVLSAVAMAANFEELAYRDPGQVDENNEKYKDDADDCLKKIMFTYPYQNRRKRRRH